LEGIKRLKHREDTRLQIIPPLLNNVISTLPLVYNDMYEATLFQTAYTIAFYGFFRVGELTDTI